jgi:hypothetical protein
MVGILVYCLFFFFVSLFTVDPCTNPFKSIYKTVERVDHVYVQGIRNLRTRRGRVYNIMCLLDKLESLHYKYVGGIWVKLHVPSWYNRHDVILRKWPAFDAPKTFPTKILTILDLEKKVTKIAKFVSLRHYAMTLYWIKILLKNKLLYKQFF